MHTSVFAPNFHLFRLAYQLAFQLAQLVVQKKNAHLRWNWMEASERDRDIY